MEERLFPSNGSGFAAIWMIFFPFWVMETVTVFVPLTVMDPVRSSPVLTSTFTARVALPVPEVFSIWIQLSEGVAVQSFSVVTYTSLTDASSASKSREAGLTVKVSVTTGFCSVGSQETARNKAATRGRMGKRFRIMVQVFLLASRGPVRGPGPKSIIQSCRFRH